MNNKVVRYLGDHDQIVTENYSILLTENKPIISDFRKEYFFLSNFYISEFTYNRTKYNCVEIPFQAAKAKNDSDKVLIESCSTPADAKEIGGRIELKNNWEAIKYVIMLNIVTAKFKGNKMLIDKLLATGDSILIEGNTWNDDCWGSCWHNETVIGKNHLGIILMRVRNKYKNATTEK
jgi:ribA/ribD-fused uncharacterized protein